MYTCSTCGSYMNGKSFKRHKTSIKHLTYENWIKQGHTSNDIGVLADVEEADEVFDVDEILAGQQSDDNLNTLQGDMTYNATTSGSSTLTTQAISQHNEQFQNITPIHSPQSDGYEEEHDSEQTDLSSLFSTLEPLCNSKSSFSSIPSNFTPTEINLMNLKSSCTLSTKTMNKIINFCKNATIAELPASYESLEAKLIHEQSNIEVKEVNNHQLSFIPLQKWLNVLLQINLLLFLVTVPSAAHEVVGDVTTGKWFKSFIQRCPTNHIPIAVDIYYDHWQVSDSTKLGGLYMAVSNTSPHFLMQPSNKFVLALVPEGVDLQSVLFAVLYDFLSHNGLFEVEIDGVSFSFYMEICRLIGDIPGLAELCCVLNHRANSPCRKCRVPSSLLLTFTSWNIKTQAEIYRILSTNIPMLEEFGQIGNARATLKEYGLKAKLPVWLRLPPNVNFDQTTHSVTCLLHNEELGIMLNEITVFTKQLSANQQEELMTTMLEMPQVPGFPRFKKIFLEKPQVLLGKEVVSITKYILLAAYPIVAKDEALLPYWESLHKHIVYLRALSHPNFPVPLLPSLQRMIISHHENYVELYLSDVDGLPVENRFVNPHMGMHWEEYIEKFGMPIFFSTMHWEPKHKQLKQIKERQTNNTDHSRDVLQYELVAQLLCCTNWLRHSSVSAAFSYKQAFPLTTIKVVHSIGREQVRFLATVLSEGDIAQTGRLLLLPHNLWKTNVMLLKSVIMHDFSFKPSDDIMIWGETNEFWFAKVLYMFAYEVNNQVVKVYAKVQWYEPIQYDFGQIVSELRPQTIHQNTMQQFDFIAAHLLQSSDVIDMGAVYRPVKTFRLNSFVPKNPDEVELIDCCYFVNKMYELEDN